MLNDAYIEACLNVKGFCNDVSRFYVKTVMYMKEFLRELFKMEVAEYKLCLLMTGNYEIFMELSMKIGTNFYLCENNFNYLCQHGV